MARRRDRDPLQIDLSPDDGDLGDGGWADAPDGSAGLPTDGPVDPPPVWFATRVARPLRERWRGMPRRLRVGVVSGAAVVVAVTVAGVAVVDARAEAAHAERMAALPGGVADLSEPVTETWRVETDAGVLAVFPGGVVVTQDGTDLLGVDVADGSEVWRHELGPARLPYAATVDGPPEMGPAADGGVYVFDHVDEVLPELDPQEAADALADGRAAGTWEDPSLRVEDALTGELRGEATIALRTAHEVARCEADDGPGGEPVRWLVSSVGVTTTATYLSVCNGASTTLAADGTVVDGFPSPTVDGETYLATDAGSVVPAADGEDGFTLPGFVLDPVAVDSTDGPWLVGRGGITAYDTAGEELWSSDTRTGRVVVRADGVAVVQNDADGTFDAVDLDTGKVRWTIDGAVGTYGWAGAATDGAVALLAVQGAESTELVALDLGDGVELWRTSHGALDGEVFSVDGHLLGVDEEYMIADGVQVSDAVLVGLGPTS
ncbi:PQQ-binding-like beta-propeller repeat protein [Isoptericola halotolerans]|uniref:outer membrane protein assembly factor BamB family protein n=1 Tax=Isoptericola halotolerans TaxID=300560 RepID=UPI00388CEE07